jgi:phenylacetate-CoA ligase
MDNILSRPWKELKSLQNRRLHYFVRNRLYPFSPYYRQLFDKNKIKPDSIRTVEDLRTIPFISKNNFLDSIGEDFAAGTLAFCLQPSEEALKRFLPKTELVKFAFLGLVKGKDYVKAALEKEYRPIFLTATAGTTNKPISFLYTSYDIENMRIYGKRLLEIIGIPLRPPSGILADCPRGHSR